MLINIHTHHARNSQYEIIQSDKLEIDHPFSFGLLHQHYPEASKTVDTIDQIYRHKNCLAVGEIGIDKNSTIDLDIQIHTFKKQLFASEKYKLPVILHCVKSWNEILQIKQAINPSQTWIFHGFRKTNLLTSVLESGVHISIGTAVIWDEKLQEQVKNIPLNRLFLETDNDTNYTIEAVYQKVALIKNISLHALKDQVYTNTKNTFQKWEIG
jgi:TatD DNase family protein